MEIAQHIVRTIANYDGTFSVNSKEDQDYFQQLLEDHYFQNYWQFDSNDQATLLLTPPLVYEFDQVDVEAENEKVKKLDQMMHELLSL